MRQVSVHVEIDNSAKEQSSVKGVLPCVARPADENIIAALLTDSIQREI